MSYFNDTQLNRWQKIFLKLAQYLFLESVFVSLYKAVLLHCWCLMSKLSEMLILVCRNIFSAFLSNLHETISTSYRSPHMQEFNPLYPHLVLYDRKYFCNLDWFEQTFIFVSSKVPFAKLWCEVFLQNSFQKCRSIHSQMSFRSSCPEVFCKKGVLRNLPKFTGKHPCQCLFINKVAGPSLNLWHRCFPVNFVKFLRTSFLTEPFWWLLLVLQNRCS